MTLPCIAIAIGDRGWEPCADRCWCAR